MGCLHSNPAVLPSGIISRQFHTEKQRKRAQKNMEARMQTALKLIVDHKRVESDAERIDASFNRIILKFPVIRHAFTSIREVFKRFDTDGNGTIDPLELRTCLSALGALLTDTDVEEMFEFAKMTEKGYLTFKEFLLCLAVGTVLQLFPLLKAYEGVDMLQASGRLSVHTATSAAGTARSARGSHRFGRASSHGTAGPESTPTLGDAAAAEVDPGAERPPTPFQTARLRAASAAAAAAAESDSATPAVDAAAAAAAAALKPRSSHSRRRSSASVAPSPPDGLVTSSSLSQVDVRAVGMQQQQQASQSAAAVGAATAPGAARPPPVFTAGPPAEPLPLLGADGKGWGQTRPAPPGVPAIAMPAAAAPPAGGRGSTATAAAARPPRASQTEGPSPPGGVSGDASGSGTSAFRRSAVFAHGQRLVKALRLVLEAYVLFDRDASGTIDRNEVLGMIDESTKGAGVKGTGAGGNALLSRERWLELDWDGDGQITFKEFLYAFMQWVGVEDDEGDELDGAPEVAVPVELLVAQQMHAQLPTGGGGGLGHTTPKASGGGSPRLTAAASPKPGPAAEAHIPSLRSVTPTLDAAPGSTRPHSLKSDASSRSGDGRSPSHRSMVQRSPSNRSRSPAAVAPASIGGSIRPVSGRNSGFATGRSANAEDAATAAAAAAGSHPPTLLHQLSASHVLAAPNHAHHVPVKSSLTASSREAIQAVSVAAHAAAVALQQEGGADAALPVGVTASSTAATPGGSLADGSGTPAPLQSFLISTASARHIDPSDVDRLLELPQKGATAATAAKLVAQASRRQLALDQQQQQQHAQAHAQHDGERKGEQ